VATQGSLEAGVQGRTKEDMDSTKKKARFAGFLYLLLGVIAPIGIMYVPGKLFVGGDALETGRRILASESLFRLGSRANSSRPSSASSWSWRSTTYSRKSTRGRCGSW
jgi:hypothetical protein